MPSTGLGARKQNRWSVVTYRRRHPLINLVAHVSLFNQRDGNGFNTFTFLGKPCIQIQIDTKLHSLNKLERK
jgi:hypothetical protein